MGTLRADDIADGAGTGAANFPFGLTVAGASFTNKIQQKNLGTAVTSNNADITDLKFSNLVIGKTYVCTLHAQWLLVAGNPVFNLFMRNNGVELARINNDLSTTDGLLHDSMSAVFVAAASTVIFDCTVNPTISLTTQTKSFLEELNNCVITTDFS